MTSKYLAQIGRAKKLIARKGSNTCVWIQAPPDINDPSNLNPEFPVTPTPVEYLVDIAFFPLTRLNQLTSTFDTALSIPNANYAGVMAGDQAFTPRYGDTVRFPDNSEHVLIYLNVTAPDTIAVVYEIYLT